MTNEGKWNIGSVSIRGHAMFGDANRMDVLNSDGRFASLDVPCAKAVREAVKHVETVATTERDGIGPAQQAQLHEAITQLLAELQKPRAAQNSGFLRKCLEHAAEVARAVPSLVKAVIELKQTLGF